MTQRIVVHGCSGSGKSTLARRLGAALELPVIELDALFHRAGWEATPDEEFRTAVRGALDAAERSHGGWIADGNYDSSLLGLVRDRASTVLWFDLPRRTVMRRIVGRTLRRVLLREPLWNGNRERLWNLASWDPERSIVRWAWTRHASYRDRLSAGAAEAARLRADQRWVRLATDRDVERYLAEAVSGRDRAR